MMGETVNIDDLRNRIENEISVLKTFEDLKRIKATILGRKGVFSEYLDALKLLDKDQKRVFGKEINILKVSTEARLNEIEATLIEAERARQEDLTWVDITMPGKVPAPGKRHPITQTF
ncbi:MAG TPA: hypothetical protein DCZ04_01835, partial [Syntrophorhabdus aromaticivorans]|nr:hypothetical protein [Syntrophorhabdus aromaticivorans]